MATTPAERPDQPLASLVPSGGSEAGEAIPIRSPVVRIGQGAQNDVSIDDDTVSSQHARLEYDTGTWRVTDLESRNGTYLEGVRLAPGVPTPIGQGALLGLGAVKFQFMTSEDVDLEQARADYSAVPASTPLAERSALRLPLWLFLVVLLVLAALIALFFWFGGDPAASEPAVQTTAAILFPRPEHTRSVTIAWKADGLSDTGLVRRGNEDALRMDPERGIFIVADGMGGHAAGEVASRLAADAALEVLSEAPLVTRSDIEDALHAAFREAFRRIVECCEGDPETAGMGTTLTVAVLKETGALHIGHIGDSRAYLLSGGLLKKLTHDHTWVQQEVDAGRVATKDARAHPLSHILTKVLTAGDPHEPDLVLATVRPADLVLLCSDGLYNMVEGQKLLQLLVADEPLPTLTQSLVAAANKRGGADNITVITIRIV